MFYVYVYFDPKTEDAIYVGKGHGKRATSHIESSHNKRLERTLKKRLREGFEINPLIINQVSENAALASEIFWIAVYGREDLKTGTLFNKTAGGDRPPISVKGRFQPKSSKETKEKISNSLIGNTRRLGTFHSEETKQKMSISHKGNKSRTGQLQSEEEKQKRRDSKLKITEYAHKGKPWSQARRDSQNKRKNTV